ATKKMLAAQTRKFWLCFSAEVEDEEDLAASELKSRQDAAWRQRFRNLLWAALRRHPWAGPLLTGWDASPHSAARQVVTLTATWVAMLALAATVQYHHGASICKAARSSFGCDPQSNGYLVIPFETCMGASSCFELYSRHLCDVHGTCPEEMKRVVLFGSQWWEAMWSAAALCSIPLLARDLPAALPPPPVPPRVSAACVAAAAGVGSVGWRLGRLLLAPLRWGRRRIAAWRLQSQFWWQTCCLGRSAWAVFQEMEAAQALLDLRHASGRSMPAPTEMSQWRAAEPLSPGAITSVIFTWATAGVRLASRDPGEIWVIITWALAVMLDGFISPIVSMISITVYHCARCKHHLLEKMAAVKEGCAEPPHQTQIRI
ncbi:hypothetical protein CYMTET_42839, partial [Cymbomonas tetramitiformis]